MSKRWHKSNSWRRVIVGAALRGRPFFKEMHSSWNGRPRRAAPTIISPSIIRLPLVASGNGIAGIRLLAGSTGNNVKDNTAQSNNSTDLVDNNANCDNNTWADNIFNTASQSCIQ